MRRQPPILSDSDRRAALAKATAVRQERAEIKAQLKDRDLTFSQLLGRVDDDTVGKMKTLTALEALPGIGKVAARRIMKRCGIAESRRLRGLGKRQRDKLSAELDLR